MPSSHGRGGDPKRAGRHGGGAPDRDRSRQAPARHSGSGAAGGQRGSRSERGTGNTTRQPTARPVSGGPGASTSRPVRRSERTAGQELPPVPESADITLLDRSVRAELRTLSKPNADAVARHLVAAGAALDSDPAVALSHAHAARARAARLAVVREAVGVAAYRAGQWSEALSELRTARRISGDPRNLPLVADCERALGRPAQAVRALDDPDTRKLDTETWLELLIVVAGARRDTGQLDAALAVLARGGLDPDRPRPGSVRLWYAYADALEAAGRRDEAATWFAASAARDPEGELDAADRAAALL